MSHSLSLYAKCKVNHKLYRVELKHRDESTGKFILRPVDGMPYQVVYATADQLRNAEMFKLFPMFRCQVAPVMVQS